ncbi:hypothetical protein [Jiella avicenniae]|uniref:Uncharacterized protein n=1 Tax=Jiella avicenniae TaxID=2907202 RepID=A0A9X1P2N8_9HYPH|nr:hypothetical protein [Jiella avicenniae]MCE7030255.1 hypothetical protein [Jiella avicenniae]
MSSLKHVILSDDEVEALLTSVLADVLAEFDFKGATFQEELDFDGEPIFRVVATVEQRVPAARLMDAISATNRALRQRGDDRFVILSTAWLGAPEEPLEEELE